MMKDTEKNKKFLRLLALCYLIAVVVYLGTCTFTLVRNSIYSVAGKMQPQQLTLQNFTHNSITLLSDDDLGRQRFVSTDADPQLVYVLPEKDPVGRVTFKATPHKPGGEITLYYTSNEDFTEKNKLWAKQAGDGSWYFDLGGRSVAAIRIDPDTASTGIEWTVENITLNSNRPAYTYFIPGAGKALVLLLAPGLAAVLINESAIVFSLFWQNCKKRENTK